MPIHTDGLAELWLFFVYLLVMIGGLFALLIMMISFVRIKLSSGNEDVNHGAQHSFVIGVISFVISMTIYFSLDQIIIVVKDLANKIA
jgi:heme/copper-type cytochrome/quinol oxidase subunit 2